MLSNSYGCLRIFVAVGGQKAYGKIEMIYDTTHLCLTMDWLFDLTHRRRSNGRSAGYRFGRISASSVRLQARRVVNSAKALFDAALRLISAAKLRRIEREFKIHGPQQDWMRIDDDHFTQVDR